MILIKMLKINFERLFRSKKFYFSVIMIFLLALLSLWPEISASGYSTSIYYLINSRNGIGAFFVATSIVITLPFGLSHWENLRNNYVNNIEVRVGSGVYCWAYTITTAISAFVVVVLGYALCFGILAVKLPMITAEEIESLRLLLSDSGLNIYEKIIYEGRPVLYFLAVFSTEALGYAFMAVFTLMLSAKIENVFVLLSAPIMLYYGSILFGNIIDFPEIYYWYFIMSHGGSWARKFTNIISFLVCIIVYFAILICLESIIFWKVEKEKRKNG